jgi:outer membrane murein-binding lipoprotein Lpp
MWPGGKFSDALAEKRYNSYMHRSWAIAAMVAVLLTVSAEAQRHGGMSAGSGSHFASSSRGSMGGSSHGSMMVSRAPTFGSVQHLGTERFGASFRGPFISSNRFHHHHHFFAGFSPWFYYGYPAYYGYPWTYGDYSYLNGGDSYQSYDSSYAQSSALAQQAEIDRLEGEVDRLRDQREARASADAPQAKKETTAQASEPTVLVFRDQHKEEVKNYAIVGETVWVFSELRARKIPLANLDVEATTKVNDDRGVEFRVPEQTPE